MAKTVKVSLFRRLLNTWQALVKEWSLVLIALGISGIVVAVLWPLFSMGRAERLERSKDVVIQMTWNPAGSTRTLPAVDGGSTLRLEMENCPDGFCTASAVLMKPGSLEPVGEATCRFFGQALQGSPVHYGDGYPLFLKVPTIGDLSEGRECYLVLKLLQEFPDQEPTIEWWPFLRLDTANVTLIPIK